MSSKSLVNPTTESFKASYADVWGEINEFESGFDSVKIDLSVMLCGLLDKAGITRGELSEKLKWKPSRVTRVLSGDENLTLKTIYEVCHAVGYTFDVVVRKANERQALQPWQRSAIAMDIIRVHKSLNHRLTEAEAILATAKTLSRRQFAMSADWKNKRNHPSVKYTQTLAANDAEAQDAAFTG
ncbi:MAG: helix-turn-helix domain-containing protein [Thiobacillus sp.]